MSRPESADEHQGEVKKSTPRDVSENEGIFNAAHRNFVPANKPPKKKSEERILLDQLTDINEDLTRIEQQRSTEVKEQDLNTPQPHFNREISRINVKRIDLFAKLWKLKNKEEDLKEVDRYCTEALKASFWRASKGIEQIALFNLRQGKLIYDDYRETITSDRKTIKKPLAYIHEMYSYILLAQKLLYALANFEGVEVPDHISIKLSIATANLGIVLIMQSNFEEGSEDDLRGGYWHCYQALEWDPHNLNAIRGCRLALEKLGDGFTAYRFETLQRDFDPRKKDTRKKYSKLELLNDKIDDKVIFHC